MQDPDNIAVNGVLYFDCEDQLVTFDLHDEVFGLVPYPKSIQRKRSDIMDFEGSVAMVFESTPGVDLWTLDNVSGKLSWTKKFSIEYELDDMDTEIMIWIQRYAYLVIWVQNSSMEASSSTEIALCMIYCITVRRKRPNIMAFEKSMLIFMQLPKSRKYLLMQLSMTQLYLFMPL